MWTYTHRYIYLQSEFFLYVPKYIFMKAWQGNKAIIKSKKSITALKRKERLSLYQVWILTSFLYGFLISYVKMIWINNLPMICHLWSNFELPTFKYLGIFEVSLISRSIFINTISPTICVSLYLLPF